MREYVGCLLVSLGKFYYILNVTVCALAPCSFLSFHYLLPRGVQCYHICLEWAIKTLKLCRQWESGVLNSWIHSSNWICLIYTMGLERDEMNSEHCRCLPLIKLGPIYPKLTSDGGSDSFCWKAVNSTNGHKNQLFC